MQSRLIVKNFGPIKFVDLDLRNVNVFIGPQASGKSALAKLFTIFKAPRKFLKNGNAEANLKAFKDVLEEYNIQSFLKEDSEIEFKSELHELVYKNAALTYTEKFSNTIKHIEVLNTNFENNFELIQKEFLALCDHFEYFRSSLENILEVSSVFAKSVKDYPEFQNITQTQMLQAVDCLKTMESVLNENNTTYIPAERNIINIIKNATFNLIKNNVPIPLHILSFGAELEKSKIKEIDLSFLNEKLTYKSVDGEDRIFINSDTSIKLAEAASGIQSVVPILLAILSRKNTLPPWRSFVIEEPEMNLFPNAQYELIKKLELHREYPCIEKGGTIHTYTTHSPYILSAFNILLYSSKVRNLYGIHSEEQSDEKIALLESIVPRNANIEPAFFSAYEIKNGESKSIFNKENGLITDNYIDEATDNMNDDFDALMDLMK
jgi:predicted ATPase